MNTMKKVCTIIFLAGAALLLMNSCDDGETVNPLLLLEDGVLVINEGNFQSPNGSADFYDPEKDTVIHGIFERQNEDVGIGATIISAFHHDDQIYFITNSPDKIEVVSADRLIYETDPIAGEDISQPRYMTVSGNKAYVSCWGPWVNDSELPHSYVAVIDLENLSVTKKIDVHDGAEGIIAHGSKVFVAGSFSEWITVIDAGTDEVIDSVQTTYAPKSFVVDENNKLWTICSGAWDSDGALLRINPGSYAIEQNFTISGDSPDGKLAIGKGNSLYYITLAPYPETGSAIYRMDVAAPSLPDEPLISGNNFYGVAVDPEGEVIYVGDSKGFTSNGSVLRYQTDGTPLDTFEVGIGPNGFIFL